MTNIQLLMIKSIAVAAVIGGLWWANQHYIVNPAVDRANATWQQRWDSRDKADAAAALEQEKQNREKEISLQAAADEEQRKADVARGDLARKLAASRAASERLQQGIQAAISALDKGSTVTGTTVSGTAGTDSGALLAELFRSVDEAAGYYAGEADRAREAGMTCERLYSNARAAQEEKAR